MKNSKKASKEFDNFLNGYNDKEKQKAKRLIASLNNPRNYKLQQEAMSTKAHYRIINGKLQLHVNSERERVMMRWASQKWIDFMFEGI